MEAAPAGHRAAAPPPNLHEFDLAGGAGEWWYAAQAWGRIGQRVWERVAEPKPLAALAAATVSVFGLGCAEGALLAKRAPRLDAGFILRYAAAQVLPSAIWLTLPAEQVVRAAGKDPARVLRVLDDGTRAGAKRALRVAKIATARSIIFGFTGVAQILRFVGIGEEGAEAYKTAIARGREPLLSGVSERVVRLAGTDSDVTWMSMEMYGRHIVPIVEKPDAWNLQQRLPEHSDDLRYPVMWTVQTGKYGQRGSWNGFKVEREWLLSTASGQKVLMLEADSSVGEQALALGHESANDLSLQEASQGFRAVIRNSQASGALQLPSQGGTDRVVRVLLADPTQTIVTGGGNEVSLGQLVVAHDEADILVDARMPLVEEILLWAESCQSSASPKSNMLIFDTTNSEYFATIRDTLKRHGWVVIDSASPRAAKATNLPRLVYQDSTADTLNTIESLIKRGIVQTGLVCALLDAHDGLEAIDELSDDVGEPIASICSAQVYNALFAEVRRLVRLNKSEEEIQAHMDGLVREATRLRR